jgi:CheY-like chemotaxis protein
MSPNDVLLVEDNEQNLELAQYLLEEAGIEVRVARNADEARSEWNRARPRLVLMDMDLPGTDGLTLVGEFRKADSGPVMVALTAHAMRGDRERFLTSGCDGYIAKPISTQHFAGEVAKYMREGH